MRTFNLTTQNGKDDAKKYLESCFRYTIPGILYKIAKDIFDSDSSKKQSEAIEKLIVAGRKEGVDEMEITIDNTKGFKIQTPEDIKVETILGSDEKIKLRIKYK